MIGRHILPLLHCNPLNDLVTAVLTATVALILSCGFIVLLSKRNPKRRRAARLPKRQSSATGTAMLILGALVPGLALVLLDNGSGFVCWLAGLTVGGWLIARHNPAASTQMD